MSNYVKYYCHMGLVAVTTLFISGSIMQTFFAEIGFSSKQIGSYTALTNVVQIMVTVLNVFIADNLKNPKKMLVWLSFSPIFLCFPMFVFCFSGQEDVTAIFYMVMFLCCVINFFFGIKSIVQFRLPYIIIDIKDYARMENTSGIISGIVSVVVSAIITFLLALYPMRRVMAGGFLLCVLFSVLSAWAIISMKVRPEYQTEPKKELKFSLKKLTKREFSYFYIPNFLRGITMGVISVLPVICRTEITTSTSLLSGLATILSLSSIAGCGIYLVIQYKLKTSKLYMVGSIVQCLFLTLMLVGKNVTVFFICYMIVCVCYNITNVAVPVFVTEIISYEDIGSYTSIRLIVMMAGQAVASYLATVVIGYVPGVVILSFAGALQLLSGIMYYCYKADSRKF